MKELTTRDLKDLDKIIADLDRKTADTYNYISGAFSYGDFTLITEYIPDDPAKGTARFRARIPYTMSKFPREIFENKSREIAVRDYLTRSFAYRAKKYSQKVRGGTGGRVTIDRPGQEVLETSAVVVSQDTLEVRFTVELPLIKGRVPGPIATELFMKWIPLIIRRTFNFKNVNIEELTDWYEAFEDADTIRKTLADRGLAAFIGEGSFFTHVNAFDRNERKDGFTSPEELVVTVDVPHRGTMRGMGIPKGVTIITGGIGQDKTDLLKALEHGVYNHIPGDGREFIITAADAVAVRSEENRRLENVNISAFFPRADTSIDYTRYFAKHANPVASQAANVIEAMDIGTSLLLIDEDTTAAPLIARDSRMQTFLGDESISVNTFIDILPVLRDTMEVSSIFFTGTSGDYFEIADTVLVMNNTALTVQTDKAKKIAADNPTNRRYEENIKFPAKSSRCPLSYTLEPVKDEYPQLALKGKGTVQYGDEFIDLSRVTQLVNQSQARGIARGLALVHRMMEGSNSLSEAVGMVIERIDSIGLDALSNKYMGDLAGFRPQELAAAVNRMKNLKVK